MKFDFVIGNPPYQSENEQNHRQAPLYDKFMSAAYQIGDVAEFITPARFLFRAGQTPKSWNETMLSDVHFCVLKYFRDSSDVFQNVDIKGGVAITIRNIHKDYGAIQNFIIYDELRSIIRKVKGNLFSPFSFLIFPKSTYNLSDILYDKYPELKGRLTKNNQYVVDAGIFEKIPEIFSFEKTSDTDIKVYGRQHNRRVQKWISKRFIKDNEQTNKYKLLISGANGTGAFGEILSTPDIAEPGSCHTQTFMSIGSFDSQLEAENCIKYIKSKFLRALLSSLKVTQNNAKETWSNIPIQDFGNSSDIDWSQPIPKIDQQLYKKYGLDQSEIDFIETHVKEMA